MLLANLIYLSLVILGIYLLSHVLKSIFKSISIILIILILIVLLKSMNEPVVILGKFKVSNLKMEILKWNYYL